MDLNFNLSLAYGYKNNSQVARILTEGWVSENMFCPRCGNIEIDSFKNNKPVADFYCPHCGCQYELKSKQKALGSKIVDGAYDTMIERITSSTNPDFFFLSYTKEFAVNNLILIPKHFFVPEIIEKRKPLASEARRAGWTGCNILIDKIPKQGIIPIIYNGQLLQRSDIVSKTNKSLTLEKKELSTRGWLMDILNCINLIPNDVFELKEIYLFEDILSRKHPENNNIRAKIRQQLQFLRDKGYLQFLSRGYYKKL